MSVPMPTEIETPQTHFDAALALTVHDIKNSLVLLLDRLEQEPPSGGRGEDDNSSVFRYEIGRINHNLARLLSLYKVGAQGYAPDFSDHCVEDFLVEQMMEYRTMLEAKGVQMDLDCDMDLWCRFDRGLLSGVIDNAISNAARYTQGQIIVSAASESGEMVIRVMDDGAGYPQRMLDQSEAIQVQPELDNFSGTTGLGLYFSAMVARMHRCNGRGGSIKLENGGDLGGSCFSIRIPDCV